MPWVCRHQRRPPLLRPWRLLVCPHSPWCHQWFPAGKHCGAPASLRRPALLFGKMRISPMFAQLVSVKVRAGAISLSHAPFFDLLFFARTRVYTNKNYYMPLAWAGAPLLISLPTTHTYHRFSLVGLLDALTTASLAMKPGSFLLSTSTFLQHESWEVLESSRVSMSWGEATLYLQRKCF